MQTASWRIDATKKEFEPVDSTPLGITWHNGPFSGYENSLVDVAPKGLRDVKTWSEVEVIQRRLIMRAPSHFFRSDDAVWYHTGDVGNAPDFLGFRSPQTCLACEVKWTKGWEAGLVDQCRGYCQSKWSATKSEFDFRLYVVAPQTCSVAVMRSLIDLRTESFGWRTFSLRLGFLQPGWTEKAEPELFLRVVWFDADDWDGQFFVNADAVAPIIH